LLSQLLLMRFDLPYVTEEEIRAVIFLHEVTGATASERIFERI